MKNKRVENCLIFYLSGVIVIIKILYKQTLVIYIEKEYFVAIWISWPYGHELYLSNSISIFHGHMAMKYIWPRNDITLVAIWPQELLDPKENIYIYETMKKKYVARGRIWIKIFYTMPGWRWCKIIIIEKTQEKKD